MLRSFDSFLLSFAGKSARETYNFVSLIVKTILLGLGFVLSLPAAEKHFVYLSFSFTLQLIKSISSDLQKLVRYFNDTSLVLLDLEQREQPYFLSI